jgi:hypothetical protein
MFIYNIGKRREEGMGSDERLSCSMCGKDGIVYMLEGSPLCPSCMTKKRPPLRYKGPERRRIQKPTMYLRREGDFKNRNPSKG